MLKIKQHLLKLSIHCIHPFNHSHPFQQDCILPVLGHPFCFCHVIYSFTCFSCFGHFILVVLVVSFWLFCLGRSGDFTCFGWFILVISFYYSVCTSQLSWKMTSAAMKHVLSLGEMSLKCKNGTSKNVPIF